MNKFHTFESFVNESKELESKGIIILGTYINKNDNSYKKIMNVNENNIYFNDKSSVDLETFNKDYKLYSKDLLSDEKIFDLNSFSTKIEESHETIPFNQEEYDEISLGDKIKALYKLYSLSQVQDLVDYKVDSSNADLDMEQLDYLSEVNYKAFKDELGSYAVEMDDVKEKIFSYIKKKNQVKEMISDETPSGDIVNENGTEFGYLILNHTEKSLEVELSESGLEYVDEMYDDMKEGKKSDQDIMFDLFEDAFSNGYTNLTGKVGLTDSIVIGYNVTINDDGKPDFDETSLVYWYPDYQVKNYVDTLITDGKLTFTKAEQVETSSEKDENQTSEGVEYVNENNNTDTYAKGFDKHDDFILVDADAEFNDNPLFYVWSEYPKYKYIKDGRLHFSYEFYTDKNNNKYLLFSNKESINDEIISELINSKYNSAYVRNVDTFVEQADKEDYEKWIESIK